MNYPIKVFLDTNVFDSHYHNFSAGKLRRIHELVDEGKVSLFLSDIVVGETKRHITRNITDARNAIRKSLSKELDKQGYESWNTGEQALRVLLSLEKYDFLSRLKTNLPVDDMVLDAISQFDTFISNTSTTIVESSNVDVASIVADYFAERPPFEEKRDKKHEFPDAFMMAKIRLFAEEFGEIIVVSNDKAFRALETNPSIKIFEELHALIVYINPFEDLIDPVKNYLNEHKQKLVDLIRDEIETMNPFIDGQDYDRKGIVSGFDYDETYIEEISDIDFDFASIDSSENDGIAVSVICKAKISASCSFFDNSESVWDSESKAYLYSSYGQTEEVHVVEFEGNVVLDFDGEQIDGYRKIKFDFSLDQNTRISQKVIEEDLEQNARADMMDTLEDYYRH